MGTKFENIDQPSHLAALLAVRLKLLIARGLEAIARDAGNLKGYADAVNVTDNQAASVRMASIPVSALLVGHGVEPVAQMTCRDRNRLAIQADGA